MNILTIITGIIVISAAFSYLNHRFLKLPGTIGVMTISVAASILLLLFGRGDASDPSFVTKLASSIDFSKVLLDLMLSFLLFAMALHFDYNKLKQLRRPVILLSTLGVLISTCVFGLLFYIITLLTGFDIPLLYCFVFGALISPTDPIAVASILRKSKIPARLDTIITGESMFNDAVGIILFVTLVDIGNPLTPDVTIAQTVKLLALEVIGGIGLGLLFGFIGYRMVRSIRDFHTIFLLSLAFVLLISMIGNLIHASIPLAAVTAGLFIGNQSYEEGHPAGRFLGQIWGILDEVLNTILFVLIGLQLVLLPSMDIYWLAGILSIVAILVARMVSVAVPAIILIGKPSLNTLTILTWAGLRGGISVALALSLPPSPHRQLVLSCCYCVVIFSVIVQGLTLNRVVNLVSEEE